MLARPLLVAVSALFFVAACDDMMAPGASNIRNPGAIAPETTATTPEGTVQTQLTTPANASECQRLAEQLENSETNAVGRQGILDQRQVLGCPPLAAIGS